MPRFFSQSVVPTAVSSSGAPAGACSAPLSQSISSFAGGFENEVNQPVVPDLPPPPSGDASSDCSQSVEPIPDFCPGAAAPGAGTVGAADSDSQSGRSI